MLGDFDHLLFIRITGEINVLVAVDIAAVTCNFITYNFKWPRLVCQWLNRFCLSVVEDSRQVTISINFGYFFSFQLN